MEIIKHSEKTHFDKTLLISSTDYPTLKLDEIPPRWPDSNKGGGGAQQDYGGLVLLQFEIPGNQAEFFNLNIQLSTKYYCSSEAVNIHLLTYGFYNMCQEGKCKEAQEHSLTFIVFL